MATCYIFRPERFRIYLNNYKSDFENFMKIYSKLYGKTDFELNC